MTDKYYYSLNFENFGEKLLASNNFGFYLADKIKTDDRSIVVTILLINEIEDSDGNEWEDSCLLFYKNISMAIEDKETLREIYNSRTYKNRSITDMYINFLVSIDKGEK